MTRDPYLDRTHSQQQPYSETEEQIAVPREQGKKQIILTRAIKGGFLEEVA